MRTDIDNKKTEIVEWLESGLSRAEVARKLNCKYDTLKVRLDRWGVVLGNQGRQGILRGVKEGYLPASHYLGTDKIIKSAILKEKLWRDGLKDRRCERCNVEDWFGEFGHLELDHIDGNKYNNNLSNLRILCANCHSLTDTNAGKNIGSYI